MAYWGGGLLEMLFLHDKYEKLRDGDPEQRERYKGFGIRGIISDSFIVALNLVVFIVIFIIKSGSIGTVVKGIVAIVFGIATLISTAVTIPYTVWQRKLNKQPVWIASLVMLILAGASSLGLIITGGVLMFVA